MQAILKGEILVVVPETEAEALALEGWKQGHAGHLLRVTANDGRGLSLKDLGPAQVACREPINVTSQSPDESVRWIGNFAATPFVLDGRDYASVESFWQGLKFANGLERRQVAALSGPAARHLGEKQGYGATVSYEGQDVVVGTWAHWQLMARACEAKFSQNETARQALLATGNRLLTHKTRRDSRTIPGVVMAEIWMEIRRKLAGVGHDPADLQEKPSIL